MCGAASLTFKPGSARNFSYGHGGELECISYCFIEPGDQAPEKHQQDFEGGSLAGPLEQKSGACHAVLCRADAADIQAMPPRRLQSSFSSSSSLSSSLSGPAWSAARGVWLWSSQSLR